MKAIGLKTNHDATVCMIENGELIFSHELEKINNGDRYTAMHSMSEIHEVLFMENDTPTGECLVAIDGGKISCCPVTGAELASYHEINNYVESSSLGVDYISCSHIRSHLLSAYCTSPQAKKREGVFCLMWDGGARPTIYEIDPQLSGTKIIKRKYLFNIAGTLYGIMRYYFGPFKEQGFIDKSFTADELSSKKGGYDYPGKLMAYIAKGDKQVAARAQEIIEYIYDEVYTDVEINDSDFYTKGIEAKREHLFCQMISDNLNIRDEDILLAIHLFIEEKLVFEIDRSNYKVSMLVGGSFLNIKWNSAIRSLMFGKYGKFDFYVPPFPNDSGTAIGAACSALNVWEIKWSVYSGPKFIIDEQVPHEKMSAFELGRFISSSNLPVLVLHGRAELGPRSLGHRSIMMSPKQGAKEILNGIKGREEYRPIAPICLEELAQLYFSPGTPDPYMIFEHNALDKTKARAPAIVHIDGTSRLQTINKLQCNDTHEIIYGAYLQSGIPILCNTSANFHGKGFLPDLTSAIKYAKMKNINFIWSAGCLYRIENI